MAIFNDTFSTLERLASGKMRSLLDALNAHNHTGGYGAPILFSYLQGQISAGQIPNSIITSAMIVDGTITGDDIAAGEIEYGHFSTTLQSIYAADGTAKYAYYAP